MISQTKDSKLDTSSIVNKQVSRLPCSMAHATQAHPTYVFPWELLFSYANKPSKRKSEIINWWFNIIFSRIVLGWEILVPRLDFSLSINWSEIGTDTHIYGGCQVTNKDIAYHFTTKKLCSVGMSSYLRGQVS